VQTTIAAQAPRVRVWVQTTIAAHANQELRLRVQTTIAAHANQEAGTPPSTR
jgi:hypothetical protein